MGNLSSIGFEVHDFEAFQNLAEMVYQKGTSIRAGDGFYVHARDDSGAELWLQMDPQRSIIGLNPHFHTEKHVKIRLEEALTRAESPMDGAFRASLANHPDHSFVFDLPNAHTMPGISLPSRSEVALACFAENLNEADESDTFRLEALSENQKAEVQLVGTVSASAFKINGWTGRAFLWLEMDLEGEKVEMVAPSKLWKGLPPKGARLRAEGWLSGRINPDKTERPTKGFFERLFWGG